MDTAYCFIAPDGKTDTAYAVSAENATEWWLWNQWNGIPTDSIRVVHSPSEGEWIMWQLTIKSEREWNLSRIELKTVKENAYG